MLPEKLLAGILMYRLRGLGSTPSPAVSAALSSASASYGVPLSLLTSVAKAESSFNPAAVSPAGAQGLMQIMPATGASLGVSNPFDPTQSANAGAQYLAQLYQQYGDWNTALIAYNEGPGNLASKGVFPASQNYADGILADSGISPSTVVDTGSVSDSSAPVDSSSAGLSTTALVALGLAAVGILWSMS
jgi:soluble lytic murein transglycosylase-like protein